MRMRNRTLDCLLHVRHHEDHRRYHLEGHRRRSRPPFLIPSMSPFSEHEEEGGHPISPTMRPAILTVTGKPEGRNEATILRTWTKNHSRRLVRQSEASKKPWSSMLNEFVVFVPPYILSRTFYSPFSYKLIINGRETCKPHVISFSGPRPPTTMLAPQSSQQQIALAEASQA